MSSVLIMAAGHLGAVKTNTTYSQAAGGEQTDSAAGCLEWKHASEEEQLALMWHANWKMILMQTIIV